MKIENTNFCGDNIQVMKKLEDNSIDVIFADPPYRLQLNQELYRPDGSLVDAVSDVWDKYESTGHYLNYTITWLTEAKRILKPTGTIWVMGDYHNIHLVGFVLQSLDFWTLNNITWVIKNPTPNFRGTRFTNATQTIIWAQPTKGAKYTFNYHHMKELNGGKQARSDWHIPLCTGKERLLDSTGNKLHSTQKPEELMKRIILSSTNPGDVILDPFFGTGTTGAIAKQYNRKYIGIDNNLEYFEYAVERISNVSPAPMNESVHIKDRMRKAPRVAFTELLENGYLYVDDTLYYKKDILKTATVQADGKLTLTIEGTEVKGLSIHESTRLFAPRKENGWQVWYYLSSDGEYIKLDTMRNDYRSVHYDFDVTDLI